MSASLHTRQLFLIFLIHAYKCLNTYRKEVGANGEDIWLSTSDFIPQQSTSYGSIKLGEVMSAEFDFVWKGRNNFPRPGYFENFFRVGFDAQINENCDGEGARYPSFWLTNNADTMHVSTSSGTTCQPPQSLNGYGTIIINVSYHIKIAFNSSQLVVQVNGGAKPDWNQTWTRQPTQPHYIGQNASVWWMSNKNKGTDFNPGNGVFSNVTIISNVFVPTTIGPTTSPTTSNPTTHPTTTTQPTINPSTTPTIIPSANPSTTPTVIPSTNPSISPTTPDPTSNPSISPSVIPTTHPTTNPNTNIPTTTVPTTNEPTTTSPTTSTPTATPSMTPSTNPTTHSPIKTPSLTPTTAIPTHNPSLTPTTTLPTTDIPTNNPSTSSTVPGQTQLPSTHPTTQPSNTPSVSPTTAVPTTTKPSYIPSSEPSTQPSISPSKLPTTSEPTSLPSIHPTIVPTDSPTDHPSDNPTTFPSDTTDSPSSKPSTTPTHTPSSNPTLEPTYITETERVERKDIHDTQNTDFWNEHPYTYIFYGAIVFVALLLIVIALVCYCKFKPPTDEDDEKLALEYQFDITGQSMSDTGQHIIKDNKDGYVSGKPNINHALNGSGTIPSEDMMIPINPQFRGETTGSQTSDEDVLKGAYGGHITAGGEDIDDPFPRDKLRTINDDNALSPNHNHNGYRNMVKLPIDLNYRNSSDRAIEYTEEDYEESYDEDYQDEYHDNYDEDDSGFGGHMTIGAPADYAQHRHHVDGDEQYIVEMITKDELKRKMVHDKRSRNDDHYVQHFIDHQQRDTATMDDIIHEMQSDDYDYQ